MKILFNFILTALILIIPSCDIDRYFGYQSNAQDLIETTNIHGRVINYYTDKPVGVAWVSFSSQETLTDFDGKFFIKYLLSEDDERNKPVKIEIFHEKYFPYKEETQLLPLDNEYKFTIRYAAPVIKKTARVHSGSELDNITCQAIVMDYQGISNIDKVTGYFFYTNDAGKIDTLIKDLHLVQTAYPNTGYYQVKFNTFYNLENGYQILAVDSDGFKELAKKAWNPFQPDTLIF